MNQAPKKKKAHTVNRPSDTVPTNLRIETPVGAMVLLLRVVGRSEENKFDGAAESEGRGRRSEQ